LAEAAHPHELNQSIVDTCTVRQPETASRAELIEEEKLLVLANFAMVTLGSFGKESLVLGKLLLIRERNTIDSLKRIVVRVTEEVRC
jgi:hypothetical protein